MIIETKISYEMIQDIPNKVQETITNKIIDAGYLEMDGRFEQVDDDFTLDTIIKYYPGRKDIRYKKFDWWKPEWMREKEIRFRRFI